MDIQKSSAAILSRPGTAFAGLPQMNIPWFESPFFEELLQEQRLPTQDEALVRSYAENGYVVLDPLMDDLGDVSERIIKDLAKPLQGKLRLQDAWKFSENVKAVAVHPSILKILQLFYQRDPIPFQTLNFPVGTEQHTHSDTVHFHCVPHRFMCGVWMALEDIDDASGPLHIYPGSHKLPVWNFHDLGLPSGYEHYEQYEEGIAQYVRALGLTKKKVLLKKGQILVWAANLLHGGEPILEPGRTRHSQVTHYYFSDCLYYTPMHSDPYIGKMQLRTITDIRTGAVVPNMYNGKVIESEQASSLRPSRAGIARRVLRRLRRTIA